MQIARLPFENTNNGNPVNQGGNNITTATAPPIARAPTNRLVPKERSAIFIHEKRWYFRLNASDDESDPSPNGSPDRDPKQNKDPMQNKDAANQGHLAVTTAPTQKKKARGLMDDFAQHEIEGKLLICMMTPTGVRLFSLFNSYIEFAKYQQKIEPHKRSFYEIILGEYPQKAHFDLDLSEQSLQPGDDLDEVGERLKDAVIGGILSVYSEIDLTTDVLVYTSHGMTSKGERKRSFHIVINNYCQYDHCEGKALFEQVMSKLPEEMKRYTHQNEIDHSVYAIKQQFRVLGSQKIGSGRPKVFLKEWTYKGQKIVHQYIEEPDSPEHEYVLQLEESLISYTSSCNMLPSLQEVNPAPFEKRKYTRDLGNNIAPDLAKRAIILLASKGGITPNDHRFPYSFSEIRGPFVILKREKKSMCPICSHVHEHENPYLIITGEGVTKHVYFDCRRARNGAKQYVGTIEDQNEIEALKAKQEAKEKQIGNWCSSVVERLKEIAAQSPEKPTVTMPLHARTPETNHVQTLLRGAKINWK